MLLLCSTNTVDWESSDLLGVLRTSAPLTSYDNPSTKGLLSICEDSTVTDGPGVAAANLAERDAMF